MSKRRNKDPGNHGQVHPQRSFEQMVSEATLQRLSGYINSEIQQTAQAILIRQQQSMATVLTRLIVTEELLCEKFSMTKEDLAIRVAEVQDRLEGFSEVLDGSVALGDRVRLEIKTKTADQTEFQGSSKLQVENTGSGQTLGTELESMVVGMTKGESREVLFGKDNSFHALIKVNKISRQLKPEPTAQEIQNADSNAG